MVGVTTSATAPHFPNAAIFWDRDARHAAAPPSPHLTASRTAVPAFARRSTPLSQDFYWLLAGRVRLRLPQLVFCVSSHFCSDLRKSEEFTSPVVGECVELSLVGGHSGQGGKCNLGSALPMPDPAGAAGGSPEKPHVKRGIGSRLALPAVKRARLAKRSAPSQLHARQRPHNQAIAPSPGWQNWRIQACHAPASTRSPCRGPYRRGKGMC
ncbi:hypothetical protein L1887_57131 [Cichorium endivia]|nr:hypothetical protein L1887_57131 [Cichorium endivia]